MKDFKKLSVWEKAHQLTLDIYHETRKFPREELYGITSQMRRASASVAANIAEGCGRGRDGEFHYFLNNAAGSAVELEYFLLLAEDLALVPQCGHENLQSKVLEIQRMLSGLLRTISKTRQSMRPA